MADLEQCARVAQIAVEEACRRLRVAAGEDKQITYKGRSIW